MTHEGDSASGFDLEWLLVPGPNPTELSAPFWAAVAEGRLMLQRCSACQQIAAYPRKLCSFCWNPDLTWETLSGNAEVLTFTRVHRPGNAAWQLAAPYVVGLVRLEEGPVLLTQLLVSTQAIHRDRACHMEPTKVGEWTLPFFRLSDQSSFVPQALGAFE